MRELATPSVISRDTRDYSRYDRGMKHFDRVAIDPAKVNGQPTIRGTRLTVRRVVDAVSIYKDRDEFRRAYPGLEDEDIRQALQFAAENLGDFIVEIPIRA